MAEKPKSLSPDLFMLDKIYQEPLNAFLFQPKNLNSLKEECMVFLDTSMLLLPYDVGPTSLADLKKIYEKLTQERRLFVSKRALQEFENRAPSKIVEIYQKMQKDISEIKIIFPGRIGILKEIKVYTDSIANEYVIQKQLAAYKNGLLNALKEIEEWHHDDPVKKMYRSIFGLQQYITLECNEDTQSDWEYRLINKIPPGFLDEKKRDSGIGDYLIWKTILAKAEKDKKDALFVTNDVSNDIWHGKLYARREMLEEFRLTTGGKTIRFIQPQQFLEEFGASIETLAEVKDQQEEIKIQNNSITDNRFRSIVASARSFEELKSMQGTNVGITSIPAIFTSNYHPDGSRVIAMDNLTMYIEMLIDEGWQPDQIWDYFHSTGLSGQQIWELTKNIMARRQNENFN